jgi:tetrahydromethanopterin S-methyltransferase subunit G
MPSDVTRDEFQELATRTAIAEREIEGEKMVTRHILEQTRHNSDDLAAIKTRLDRVERKVDGLDQKIDGVANRLDSKIDGVESRLSNMIGSLERSLPRVVGDVVREVYREERERKS